MRPRLRLFPDASLGGADDTVVPEVPLPLGDLVNVLRHAVHKDRVWIDDFADEEILVSQDLYEILSAYRRIQDAA